MNDLDTYLLIIMLYTSLAHFYLEAYEEYTMNTRMALVSVAVAALFYLVAWFCFEMGQPR